MATTEIAVPADETTYKYEAKYRFNKDDLGNKRNPVELAFDVPSLQGLVDILEAEDGNEDDSNPQTDKVRNLVLEAIADIVNSQVKSWVSDNPTANQAEFDAVKQRFTFKAIALMDKKDRRSSGIAPELWQAFAKKYQEVMPAVTKISPEGIKNATIVFLKKFSIIKTDKVTIGKLLPQLALFTEHCDKESLEQFADIIELLQTKGEEYINSDEVKNIVDNLGL
jgi:hypothetical protein